jgi:hypothetical protein
MLDLQAGLKELADAATRHGTTTGPAHAIRRGRQRRRRVVAAAASLLVVALAAAGLLGGRLGTGRELPAVGPPATMPEAHLARLDLHTDLSGATFPIRQMVRDLASMVEPCAGGERRAELVGYVRSERYGRLVMVVAVPSRPGEIAVCWTAEVFGLGGGREHGLSRGDLGRRPADRRRHQQRRLRDRPGAGHQAGGPGPGGVPRRPPAP